MDDGRSPAFRKSAVTGFFRARWQGESPLGLIFWRDMAVVGTTINVAATLLAVGLLGLEFPLGLVLAVHFLPIPYNIFLFMAVWRISGRVGGWPAQLAPLGAAAWLALTIFL